MALCSFSNAINLKIKVVNASKYIIMRNCVLINWFLSSLKERLTINAVGLISKF